MTDKKEECTLLLHGQKQQGLEMWSLTLYFKGESFHSEFYESRDKTVDAAFHFAKKLEWSVDEVLVKTSEVKNLKEV